MLSLNWMAVVVCEKDDCSVYNFRNPARVVDEVSKKKCLLVGNSTVRGVSLRNGVEVTKGVMCLPGTAQDRMVLQYHENWCSAFFKSGAFCAIQCKNCTAITQKCNPHSCAIQV